MKKQLFFLLPVVSLVLTACENYSSHSGTQPGGQQNRGAAEQGRRDQGQQQHQGNQPGGQGHQDTRGPQQGR